MELQNLIDRLNKYKLWKEQFIKKEISEHELFEKIIKDSNVDTLRFHLFALGIDDSIFPDNELSLYILQNQPKSISEIALYILDNYRKHHATPPPKPKPTL